MTTFWLNDELVDTDAPDGTLVLDFVRRRQRTGTKEGCKEGDCGACTVLVGEPAGNSVAYSPVTSCLVPLGEMHGKHVVTVEGINFRDRLSFVQDRMVARGGSQCGYCTPGFVVSMTWFLLASDPEPSMDGFERAISGNLCRCTGYNSITRAGADIVQALGPGGDYAAVWAAEDRIDALVSAGLLPSYFVEMPSRLAAIPGLRDDAETPKFFVAGGTDLYVQRGEEIPGSSVSILGRHPELRGVEIADGRISVGALTTFTELAEIPAVRALIPRIDDFMFLVASLQIRNRATLGGNIVNASPIGDVTNLLLGLDADLTIIGGDDGPRVVPMRDFFLGYKQLDLHRPLELVSRISFDLAGADTRVNFEKVSKRKALDIATVCSGCRFEVDPDDVIRDAHISMGGVGPIPMQLPKTANHVVGKPVTPELALEAARIAMTEVSPISDVRGSADYKRLLTRQLTIAHFVELFDNVSFDQMAS